MEGGGGVAFSLLLLLLLLASLPKKEGNWIELRLTNRFKYLFIVSPFFFQLLDKDNTMTTPIKNRRNAIFVSSSNSSRCVPVQHGNDQMGYSAWCTRRCRIQFQKRHETKGTRRRRRRRRKGFGERKVYAQLNSLAAAAATIEGEKKTAIAFSTATLCWWTRVMSTTRDE